MAGAKSYKKNFKLVSSFKPSGDQPKAIEQIIDHFEQISSIFAHEKRHYDDFRELGFEGYKQTPHDVRERRVRNAICYLWQSRKLSTEFTGH